MTTVSELTAGRARLPRLGLVFPPAFTFGSATASYQVEGGFDEDGRGPSIWDTFSKTPGQVWNGDTGDVACDHYHRWESDLDLMASLGLDAYRFSIAGRASSRPAGDPPTRRASTSTRGSSTDCSSAASSPSRRCTTGTCRSRSRTRAAGPSARPSDAFEEYAAIMGAALGDRVHTWTTLNEPWCSAYLGYGQGGHAPGRHEPAAALAAVHHLNLAHGRAVQALRATSTGSPEYSVDAQLPRAARSRGWRGRGDAADRRAREPRLHRADAARRVPADLLEDTASVTDWSFVQDGDLAAIHQPIDVLGVNYYSTATVRLWDGVSPKQMNDGHKGAAGGTAWPGSDADRGVRRAAGAVHRDGLEHRARGPRGAARRRCRSSSRSSRS